jgi:predicted nucleic acid-binding protein
VSGFVLDASVALAWVVDRKPDPYAQTVQRKMREGARPVVPALWQLEVANALVTARRRETLTKQEAEEGLEYLQRFATTIAEIDDHFLGVREAFLLSMDLGLTAYDSVYFELARRESLPLATLDKALRLAAAKKGIPAL